MIQNKSVKIENDTKKGGKSNMIPKSVGSQKIIRKGWETKYDTKKGGKIENYTKKGGEPNMIPTIVGSEIMIPKRVENQM